MEIFKLFGSILVDNDKANQSLNDTDKRAGGVAKTLGKGIATAAKWGAGLALAAGAGAAALFGVATKAAESTDRIDKLSQKIGLSRKGFQEWDYILSQSGASVEDLQSGFKTFTKQIDEASKGTKLSTEYFDDLGVSITDNKGKLKGQEQMFNETVMALQGMEEGPKKAALANNLLGRSASELAPLINGATGSVEEMRKKANELGLVIGDDAVDAGVKFTDSVDQMKRSMGALVTNIGASVMPIMQGMLEWFTAHMPQIKNVSKIAFDVIGSVIKTAGAFITNTLVPAFKILYDWIQPNIPAIKETIRIAFDLIKTSIDKVIETVSDVIDWFKKYQDILIPLGAGIATISALILANEIRLKAVALATKAWTAVTKIATAAQAALNFVMNLNPMAKVILVIGLLVAAGVALYRNWDTVKSKTSNMWIAIENSFRRGVNGAIGWINSLIRKINRIPGVNAPLISRIELKYTNNSKATTMDDRLGNSGYESPGNNAQGTDYWRGGPTWVGEEGPEIVRLPRGSQIFSNSDSMAMAGGGVTFGYGAFAGANIMDDYGVDRLMDRVMDRLALKGVR